jgi:N-formylglutamate deformylase
MSEAFHIVRPKGPRRPVIISSPHSGTEIPPALLRTMEPRLAAALPDTDWFVHELYGFAPEFGITLVHARFSRFVVDLNRDPQGAKLYTDGRPETSYVPQTTFAQEPLYPAPGTAPTPAEEERRRRLYFEPYHQTLTELVSELRREFRHVLLYDAHSIRRHVPQIRRDPFPDMILGDQKGRTAAPELTVAALAGLRQGSGYAVSHNDPFMGGYITRHFGRPDLGIHALQLEMSQDVYMDEGHAVREPVRAARVQVVLKRTLEALADTVGALK